VIENLEQLTNASIQLLAKKEKDFFTDSEQHIWNQLGLPLACYGFIWWAIVERTTQQHQQTYNAILTGNKEALNMEDLAREIEAEQYNGRQKIKVLLEWAGV